MKTTFWCEELGLVLVSEPVNGKVVLSGHRTKDWEDLEMNVVRIENMFYDKVDACETKLGLLVTILMEVK